MKKFSKILESKSEKSPKAKIKSELEDNNDYQMVSGIIDILKKVKDKENRMEIANDMVAQFKREKIKFDYENFINTLK
jgi:preprotein translocase subunit YajC